MTEPQLDERRPFAMIPQDMLFDPEVAPGAVKVFGVLHRFGSTPDRCFPSLRLVSEKTGIGVRQVRRHIEFLEKAGWLKRVPRKTEAGDPDSNGYHLFPQRGGTDTDDRTSGHGSPHPRSSVSGGSGQERPHPRSSVSGGSGHGSPEGADMGDRLKRAKEREPVNETPSPNGEVPHDEAGATVIDISTREERPPAPTFDDFWAVYPRKVGKIDARKAWDKAIRDGCDPQVIVDGARAYAANSHDKQFVKYPQGWLNGHRWEDEVEDLPKPKREEPAPKISDQFAAASYRGASPWG